MIADGLFLFVGDLKNNRELKMRMSINQTRYEEFPTTIDNNCRVALFNRFVDAADFIAIQ